MLDIKRTVSLFASNLQFSFILVANQLNDSMILLWPSFPNCQFFFDKKAKTMNQDFFRCLWRKKGHALRAL
ncbi:MAG: hypothetical protein C0514_09365 [Candidatus Puniceispirillum sp.]|nr:hypothetical protein [Candidatus Puniceispirillum sp.]